MLKMLSEGLLGTWIETTTPEYKKRREALLLDTTETFTLYLYPEEAGMG